MEEKTSIAAKLNWLRAGVLGANDGIISTAGVVMGVAATGAALGEIATAGMAAVTAGAVSMALGEYVSVSAQRDTERAMISQHAEEVRDTPDDLEADIRSTLEKRGLNPETARIAAQELAAGDLLHAHLMVHHNVDSKELTNPWAAALSSAVAFLLGSIFPWWRWWLPPPAPAAPRHPDRHRRRPVRHRRDFGDVVGGIDCAFRHPPGGGWRFSNGNYLRTGLSLW